MPADVHPTREEWAARQAAGPLGLQLALAAAASGRAVRDAEVAARVAESLRRADDRRAEFEAAVRAELDRTALGWLAPYRTGVFDADADVDDRLFRLTTKRAAVEYDPRDAGCWPVRLEMWRRKPLPPGGCSAALETAASGPGEWSLPRWAVERPTGTVFLYDAAEVVEAAADYCDHPF